MEAVTTEKRFISLREKLEAAKLSTIPARVAERKQRTKPPPNGTEKKQTLYDLVVAKRQAEAEQQIAQIPSDVVFQEMPRIAKAKPTHRCFRCQFDLDVFCTLCAAWSKTNDLTTARALFVTQDSIW